MSLVALANVRRRRRVRHPLPRRPARAGDRAAAPGARAARGDSLGAAAGRRRDAGTAAFRCSRRGASARRTRPARTRTSCRTAATPTALTHAGGGFSIWRDLAVTRRREDRTSDAGAHFIYLRDPWSGSVWSPTLPAGLPGAGRVRRDVRSRQGRRSAGATATSRRSSQVTVSPEDDVEVRRLSITNRGDQPREIEVTSYAEIVLARPEDDLAHPAFGKLFIETEFDAQSAGLLFSRRPRAADEAPLWAFHVLGVDGTARRRRRVGNRSRALPRPRPIAGQSRRARRPGAVRHDRRGARSRSPRCASGSGWRPARSCASPSPPASRRTATPRSRWRASIATAAPPRARSRWRSRTCTSRCSTWASPTSRRCSSIGSRRACSAPTRSCISPRRPRPQHARAVESVGLRHLRRSADRARPRRRRRHGRRSSATCCTRRSTGASRGCAPMW